MDVFGVVLNGKPQNGDIRSMSRVPSTALNEKVDVIAASSSWSFCQLPGNGEGVVDFRLTQ